MTGPLTRNLLRVHAGLVYAFLYAPILVLVTFSFNKARRGARWTGFTNDWYAKLAANEQMRQAMLNSLVVAGIATAVTTLIGTAAALGLHRLRPGGRGAGATRGL